MVDFRKKKREEKEVREPKTDIQRLMDIVNNRKDNHIKQPIGLPEHPQEIAKTWINFCEPRLKYEIIENGIDQYQERIADCLTIYYKLSHADQGYLQRLRSNGMYWRGDSIEFMREREKVTHEMVADKTQLRLDLHKMLNKMVTKF